MSTGPADALASSRFAAIVAETAELAARFAAAGHRLYLVGGTVRDLVAGDDRPQFDLDATTTARPADIKRLVQGWADAVWTQGERFGTIGAMKRSDGPDGPGTLERIFEITTHRAEAYRGDSRKPDVAFSDDVVADLSRRDFTVNSMAVELTSPTPTLVDPFHGVDDLRARVLRTPLTPHESFGDDPLRMLRAARFVARYDLAPVDDLVDAVRSMGERMRIVSAERVRDELDKLLVGPSPETGLRFVLDTGLAPFVLPELAAASGVSPIDVVAAVPGGHRAVRWAAVLSGTDRPTAQARLQALRASTADTTAVATLVGLHRELAGALDERTDGPDVVGEVGWSDADVRHLAHRAGSLFDDLLVLERAVQAATPGDAAARRLACLDRLGERVRLLSSREDLGALRPELDGAEVMRALGLQPGREVGAAMAFLLERRLEQGPMEREAALDQLREWWTRHSK
ncbi:MAG: CCA tRNA nucleotidyltransferase [Acidimicrobiales bacterium]